MHKSPIVCFLFLLFASSFAFAQSGTETPYSRYGIGELYYNGFARQTAMGGLGAAYQSTSAVNFSNPASYSHLRITTFETALRGELACASSSGVSQTKKGMLLNYLSLGFPVIKDLWGASFGLIPVSSSGYNLKDAGTTFNPNDTITSSFTRLYSGKGGLSRFYIGNGVAPFTKSLDKFYDSQRYEDLRSAGDSAAIHRAVRTRSFFKGLAVGFNASYLFGTLVNERKVVFDDPSFMNIRNTDNTSYNDFYFDYGFTWAFDLKNDYSITIGASGAGGTNIRGRRDVLQTLIASNSIESNIDTVYMVENEKGKIFMPSNLSAGIVLQQSEKWLIGAEFNFQQWSRYKSFNEDQNLSDSWRISAGGQYMPTPKLLYRAGLRYERTNINLRNTPVNDFAVSLGAGVPIRLTSTERRTLDNRTMLHFTLEAGQMGTTTNNLVRQQYVRLYVGITANELWFIKRKYD